MRASGILACVLVAACGGGGSTDGGVDGGGDFGAPHDASVDGGVGVDAGAADLGGDAGLHYATCPEEPRATPESLAAKAAAYDARALALHVAPQMPWVLDVQLAPGTDPTTATSADVVAWRSGENDGLWSALYLASQAYRYAATHDAAARDAMARLLDGERQRMEITGVPGLFTRQLIPPGVSGIACPTDPAVYQPTPDKRGNRWVRVDAAGCAEVTDASLAFVTTTHCGLDAYAGWCFLDNVSQDEYVGHVFALAAVARLVDDVPVHDAAVSLLRDVGQHLVAHDMEFVDWDGRATQWGHIHPGAVGDSPGYLAVMGVAFLGAAAEATGDPVLAAMHDARYAEWSPMLADIDVWAGPDGCESNWNDLSMLNADFYLAVHTEHDAARRTTLEDLWSSAVMRAPLARAGELQRNAWWNLMWGELTYAPDPVHDAMCALRQFPASNHVVARDTEALAPDACMNRFGGSSAASPFDVADRCAATFAWWGDPYERRSCTDAPELVQNPAGYLLPYWMARAAGIIGAAD